jgi:hypothetical protein
VHVVPEQLHDAVRKERWQRIVAAQRRFAKYHAKTDGDDRVGRLQPPDRVAAVALREDEDDQGLSMD